MKLDTEVDFFDGIFVLEPVQCIVFTVSRSGASLPRTPPRTFSSTSHLLAPLAPPCRPLAGCEFHDSCPPVCAGSKLNIYPLLPERAAASLAGAGAHRAPIRLVGARAGSPSSPLPARHRTARDSLCGSRRARAALMPSRCELSRRAFPFACTFGLPRREL